jgi:hypothetical protein
MVGVTDRIGSDIRFVRCIILHGRDSTSEDVASRRFQGWDFGVRGKPKAVQGSINIFGVIPIKIEGLCGLVEELCIVVVVKAC